jgi:disulfide bond formation protein DsbB
MELFGILSTAVWIAIASLATFAVLISFFALKKKEKFR